MRLLVRVDRVGEADTVRKLRPSHAQEGTWRYYQVAADDEVAGTWRFYPAAAAHPFCWLGREDAMTYLLLYQFPLARDDDVVGTGGYSLVAAGHSDSGRAVQTLPRGLSI